MGCRKDKAASDEDPTAAPPCLVECVGSAVDSPFGGSFVAQEGSPGVLSWLGSEE